MSVTPKQTQAKRRARRARSKISGTAARPRLAVSASLTSMFVQLIDDQAGQTLLSARSPKHTSKPEQPVVLGKLIAEKALAAGIKTMVFDRGAKQYHGRVKALAEALRAGGLVF